MGLYFYKDEERYPWKNKVVHGTKVHSLLTAYSIPCVPCLVYAYSPLWIGVLACICWDRDWDWDWDALVFSFVVAAGFDSGISKHASSAE